MEIYWKITGTLWVLFVLYWIVGKICVAGTPSKLVPDYIHKYILDPCIYAFICSFLMTIVGFILEIWL